VLNQPVMNAPLRQLLRALLLISLLLLPGVAQAQEPRVSISVLTMGPGDPTFSKFGHNAIVVKQRRPRQALVYNFGTFTFRSPNLVSDFLNRRLNYWLSVDTYEDTLRSYRAQNRTVIEQELALSPEQSLALAKALEVNALRENRYYRYDYYFDNCSTRVRDALDRVLGGAIKKAAGPAASQTFREHSLRLAGDDPLLFVGLDFGLSGYADQPQSEWDEAFLPERFAALLRRVKIQAADGSVVPLVRSERVLFEADRAPPPEAPPQRLVPLLALGTVIGLALAALGSRRESALGRWCYGLSLLLLGLIVGAAGGLLLFFWLATAHEAAWSNANLLLAPPWLLALGVAGVAQARQASWGSRLLRLIVVATLATSLLALLLNVTALSAQVTSRIAALLVPIWLGVAAAEVLAARRAGTPQPWRVLFRL